jgi:tellurite resistance protein TerC
MAIVFRVIFITVGVALVERVSWVMYIFGAFLLYTGIRMFKQEEEKEFEPEKNSVYKFLKKIFPIVPHDGEGKFSARENGKKYYTILFVVVMVLATIDIAFALDSIPAVMGISKERLIIYTSNIFAVLGLRSLFFLLKGAVNKFDYLPQGISIVLIFIGVKMLAEHYINQCLSKNSQTLLSLAVILVCISGSIWYSAYHDKKLLKNK